MIYLGYALVYPARVCTVRMGYWTEAQLLYQFAGACTMSCPSWEPPR